MALGCGLLALDDRDIDLSAVGEEYLEYGTVNGYLKALPTEP